MTIEELQLVVDNLKRDLDLFKKHDHLFDGERIWSRNLLGGVTDATLTLTDITTNDVSSSKHGFAPKSPADATKFLNGAATPAWTVPSYPTNLTLTDTQASDVTALGIIISKTAGENLVFGDVVYFKSDGKVWKADANAAGLYPAVGLAIATINANDAGNILLKGIARNDAWGWTIGGVLYLSITAGSLTQTQPSAADDIIQVLGVAHPNADTIYFNPSMDYISHI
jgi:predicted RecA/RadA family phage recombinase